MICSRVWYDNTRYDSRKDGFFPGQALLAAGLKRPPLAGDLKRPLGNTKGRAGGVLRERASGGNGSAHLTGFAPTGILWD